MQTDRRTFLLASLAAVLTGGLPRVALADEALEAERQALQIQVSRQSADRMLELLDNPEPINPKLREAALNHRKLAGDFKNRRNQ